MKCFSYVVPRDYGFAPNPFGQFCTLATCKPDIRGSAKIGDMIIGTGSRKYNFHDKLIYAMYVEEKLDFNTYWEDERFQYKKPVLNGSLKLTYGDNIYYLNAKKNIWVQTNSHHSLLDGSPNPANIKKDLKKVFVLISTKFWYFGSKPVSLPQTLQEFCINRQGYKCNFPDKLVKQFIEWINENYQMGYHADPYRFNKFERYNGK